MTMRMLTISSLLLLAACTTTLTPTPTPLRALDAPPFVRPSNFKGVVLIVLENTDPDEAAAMAFVRALPNAVQFRQYYALAHPSRPNYVGIVSGSIDGINGDREPRPPLTRRHLGDLLDAAGIDWRVYAEDYPNDCGRSDKKGAYARRHLGFLDFADVQGAKCSHITTTTALTADVAAGRVPPFALVIPNNEHNGHNRGPASADAWLQTRFAPLLANRAFTDGRLFVITYDEDEGHDARPNRVLLVAWGDPVQPPSEPSTLDVTYDHYDLLRTLESLLGVGTLGAHDDVARPFGGIWR